MFFKNIFLCQIHLTDVSGKKLAPYLRAKVIKQAGVLLAGLENAYLGLQSWNDETSFCEDFIVV